MVDPARRRAVRKRAGPSVVNAAPALRPRRPAGKLKNLRIGPARERDRKAVVGLQRLFRLTPGFDQKEFRVAEHRAKVVGCARLRFLGDSYELASVGVKQSYHGRGVGTALVLACLDAADEQVFLLTEAPSYFSRFGFKEAPAGAVPAELLKKMNDWCPSSAACMVHGGNPKAKTYRLLRDKCVKDLDVTRRALDKLKISVPRRSHYRKVAEDFLSMAKAYYSDAWHFFEKNDLVLAFACVNYAHGWLDSGARLGLFDVGEDDKLFTLAQ